MDFKKWRIQNRLIFNMIISFVVFLSVGLLGIMQSGKLFKYSDYIATNTVDSVDTANKIATLANDYVIDQYAHIITEDKEQMSSKEKLMGETNNEINQLIQKYTKDLITNGDDRKLIEDTQQQWNQYLDISGKVITLSRDLKTAEAMKLMNEQGSPAVDKMANTLNDLVQFNQKIAVDDRANLVSTYNSIKLITITLLIVGSGIMLLINILILFSITKPLTINSSRLGEASKMIAGASGQLAASSQMLAEASSEQAASIEEVSATMDESSSMVIQSTDNTRQASSLSNMAYEASSAVSGEMKEMMNSMDEIKNSSSEIGKIIKVIDEIAFQTNILALNAAVEAARAGDAGKGFAVVAEEVRNLAQRSAKAAKDTATIIENNIQLSTKGGEAAFKVNDTLKDISDKIHKLNDLMSEIAAASQEQAQGIEQVNKAISQMEDVTQQNASGAEESASAAEELNAQALVLENIVTELTKMVNGDEDSNMIYSQMNFNNNVSKGTASYSNKFVKNMKSSVRNHKTDSTRKTNSLRAKDIIPLDEDDEF